jgi:hypothetical protein
MCSLAAMLAKCRTTRYFMLKQRSCSVLPDKMVAPLLARRLRYLVTVSYAIVVKTYYRMSDWSWATPP